MLYSNSVKPVVLPPGRARPSTNPPPTGSATSAKTIGTVRVVRCSGPNVVLPIARMTSGSSAMSSAAYWRKRSASPSQRASIRTLRPSVQPSSCNPCRNAIRRRDDSGSVAGSPISTPMRRTRSLCCALAAGGHDTAAPPSNVMNWRRPIIRSPRRRGRAATRAHRGRAPWRS